MQRSIKINALVVLLASVELFDKVFPEDYKAVSKKFVWVYRIMKKIKLISFLKFFGSEKNCNV